MVSDRAARLTRLRCDLQALCPDLLAITGAVDNRWFLRFLTCRDRLTELARLHAKTVDALPGVGDKTQACIRTWQRSAQFGGDIDLADRDLINDARTILAFNEQIDAINRRIEAIAAPCPMAQRLRTTPGFGLTGTAELAGEIGALKRFDTDASLALYLGVAPLDHSSGLQRPKCVNTRCQNALMTCIVRHMANVPESRAYYDRKRAEGKHHNQAVRALVRHLVRVIWRMLKNERDYEMKTELELKTT